MKRNPLASLHLIYRSFPILCLLSVFVLASCDSISGDSSDKTAIIENVTYVNKQLMAGRATDLDQSFAAIDLTITLSKEVKASGISRMLLFYEGERGGIGWEIQDRERFIMDGKTLTIQNLIITTGMVGDSYFDLTLDWTSGKSETYKFIHKNFFIQNVHHQLTWLDPETLSSTISSNYQLSSPPDSVEVVWLNEDVEVGNTMYRNEAIQKYTLALSEIPATATAFYAHYYFEVNGIKLEYYSHDINLPERLPSTLEFIEGIESEVFNNNYQNFMIKAAGDLFFMVAGSDNGYGLLNADLFVIDASTKSLLHTFELTHEITSFKGTDEAVYIGYQNGRLEKIDLSSQTHTTMTTFGGRVNEIGVIDHRILVSLDPPNPDHLVIFDTETGEIVSTNSYYGYAPTNMVYSPILQKGFSDKGYVGPQDLMQFSFSDSSGAISNISESIYHGDHQIAGPFQFGPDHSYIITTAGTIFDTEDLTYLDKLPYAISGAQISETDDLLLGLRPEGIYYLDELTNVLDIYTLSDKTLKRSLTLFGIPRSIILNENELSILTYTEQYPRRVAIYDLPKSDLMNLGSDSEKMKYLFPNY